jgi:hypothetical protein
MHLKDHYEMLLTLSGAGFFTLNTPDNRVLIFGYNKYSALIFDPSDASIEETEINLNHNESYNYNT